MCWTYCRWIQDKNVEFIILVFKILIIHKDVAWTKSCMKPVL